jgi:ornithine cyclodeaminase
MPSHTREEVRSTPHFTDAAVAAAVSTTAAIAALRDGFVAAHQGLARPIAKSMQQWEDDRSSAHALGAVDLAAGVVGFKYWVNTPRGAQAALTLFDAHEGRVCATFSAAELGMLRTAGTAALATDLLAPADADEAALLGTGRQAYHQVVALRAVRPIGHLHLWSPRAESRRLLAERLVDELGLAVTCHETWQAAVADRPIVTSVTRASAPFIEAEHLAVGAHVNAVGAILPTSAELEPSVVLASDLVVVDDLENARRASAELNLLGAGLPGVATLGALLAGDVVRPETPRLTLFKGLGSGIADVAIAAAAYRRQTGGI